MDTRTALSSLPAEEWIADQVVVFDWSDGPREGVARLAKPQCEFAFELLAERTNADGVDDRLFLVHDLPAGSVAAVLDSVRKLGAPAGVVWVPVWKFDDEDDRLRTDREIDRILSSKRPTTKVVHSRDMFKFLGHRDINPTAIPGVDWFQLLGISRER